MDNAVRSRGGSPEWSMSATTRPETRSDPITANKIRVDLGAERSYPIYIGEGLLSAVDTFRVHVTSKKALVVTNVLVGPLYADTVRRSLEQCGVEVFVLELPDGEVHKCMEGVMRIVDAAMDAKLDRKSMMVALG